MANRDQFLCHIWPWSKFMEHVSSLGFTMEPASLARFLLIFVQWEALCFSSHSFGKLLL